MTEVKRPVPDARQRQAWRKYFKKLRQQQEQKDGLKRGAVAREDEVCRGLAGDVFKG